MRGQEASFANLVCLPKKEKLLLITSHKWILKISKISLWRLWNTCSQQGPSHPPPTPVPPALSPTLSSTLTSSWAPLLQSCCTLVRIPPLHFCMCWAFYLEFPSFPLYLVRDPFYLFFLISILLFLPFIFVYFNYYLRWILLWNTLTMPLDVMAASNCSWNF